VGGAAAEDWRGGAGEVHGRRVDDGGVVIDHVGAGELLHEVDGAAEDDAVQVLDLATLKELCVAERPAGVFDSDGCFDLMALVLLDIRLLSLDYHYESLSLRQQSCHSVYLSIRISYLNSTELCTSTSTDWD
jgi:hypothetical protein